MALSLLSFFVLAVSGLGLCHGLARRTGLHSNLWVELGLGFFCVTAAVGYFLSMAWLPISQASLLIVFFSGFTAVLAALALKSAFIPLKLGSTLHFINSSWLTRFCGGLILIYLGFTLLNNLNREIFPWDAFTTWMFRAKAWVTTDTAIEFVTLKEWLAASSGFTLPAAHYPITISAIAAFSSALAGEWSGPAASIPWFFAIAASGALMGGLCRLQAPDRPTIALLGATLLITIPLVHWHSVLAGYADIWVMGSSGMGLAGICLWTQHNKQSTLAISLLLLGLGCVWKTEGWLWLILGCAIVTLFAVWRRFSVTGLIALASLVAALWLLQPLDLGPLGVWGGTADRLSTGVLGNFATRPYNAAPDYLNMTVLQGNFLLLIPLYFLALLYLTVKHRRAAAGYLVMAAGLFIVHAVVFGLSEYSRYAEIGTAVNRFLLQSLPVLIITLTAVWALAGQFSSPAEQADTQQLSRLALTGAVIGASIAMALPLTLWLHSLGNHAPLVTEAQHYDASELIAVVGNLNQTEAGYQFSGNNIPVGVAAIPLPSKGAIQPRYLVAESSMATPESLSVYWINSTAPGVHSAPLAMAGRSILDMSAYPDFWQQPIEEMGFLAKPAHFASTAIGAITLTDSLLDTIPALVHHWASPEPVSHRLINTTIGHASAPATLHNTVAVALVMLCLLGFSWQIVAPGQTTASTHAVGTGALTLWLIGSLAHLNQVTALSQPQLRESTAAMNAAQLEGQYLRALTESLREDPALAWPHILTIGLDPPSRFEAQRLPYMLLPLSAAAIDTRQLAKIAPDFSGTLILFAKDEARLQEQAAELLNTSTLTPRESGAGYLVLTPAAQ
jgi:hypothetical protein